MRKFVFTTGLLAVIFSMQGIDAASARGSSLLGSLKINLFSSDVSVSHHQTERGGRTDRIHRDCWYENTWQNTRHGRRLIRREQKCK